METYKEEIRVTGKTILADSVRIDSKVIIITGRIFKTARIKDDWWDFEDLQEPELLIDKLKKAKTKADIFTFIQRLPQDRPRYTYQMEWESMAVMSIKSYKDWFEKQIGPNVRRKIRKGERMGLIVKMVGFDDELVKGITSIYNESPIRQGKPFWHYGKDFHAVKKEASTYLDRSGFIGAYYDNELIGFIKVVYTEKFMKTMHVIAKTEHRDKAPVNGLLAKAVEICERKGVPYLIYGEWSRGTLGDFKRYNGFEKVDFPRYYVPLTIKGQIILKLRLHRDISKILPENMRNCLIRLRKKWHGRKYARRT